MTRTLRLLLAVGALAALTACTGGKSGGGGVVNSGGVAGRAMPAQPNRPGEDAPLTTPAKIRTAEITVAVRRGTSVAAQADAAEAIAAGAGGEVDADDRTAGPSSSATVVLRVPPDRLSAVLGQLDRLGRETSRHVSTVDVTQKVADVNSRVASARAAIDRLRALYARATRVSDVIAIESELSSRESDLESLEAQQRALLAQTDTAAITLTLVPAPRPAPPPAKHRGGFLGGLSAGWHALVHAGAAFATAVGAVLPFLLVALVLFGAVRLLWPRWRRPRVVSDDQANS